MARVPPTNRFHARSLLPWVALCMLALPLTGRGESRVYWVNRAQFAIPIDMKTAGSANLRQIILHASSDGGKTYTRQAATTPATREVTFNAPKEGWYYFTLQAEDRNGYLSPAKPHLALPGLRVCVDLTPPVIQLQSVRPEEGTVGVEWKVTDANLDLDSLRLRYRPIGGKWLDIEIRKLPHAQRGWTPQTKEVIEVEMEARDKAGNKKVATLKITPNAQPAQVATPQNKGPRTIHVRTKKFSLRYNFENVGTSGIKHVEVWYTRDTDPGKRIWSHYADAPARGPYLFPAANEGHYGIILRPRSNAGQAPPGPAATDPPSLWVVVDQTKPVVTLNSVIVGTGKEQGTITINWSAIDPNLKDRPISIQHSATKDGPWTTIQGDLANDGSVRLKTAGLPDDVFIRVEAVDKAGNKGAAQTREAVKVDTLVPRVKDIDVAPVDVGPGH